MAVSTEEWREAILSRAQELSQEPRAVVEEIRPHIQAGRFPGITRKEAALLAKGKPFTTKQILAAFRKGI